MPGVEKQILRLGLGLKHYISEGEVDVDNELLCPQHKGLAYRSGEGRRVAQTRLHVHVLKHRITERGVQ